MTQIRQPDLHRRGLLSLAPAFAIAACSRSPAKAEGTYAVVDTYSEIALAPDGSRCATQSIAAGINTILLVRNDLSDARLLSLPEKNHWVRDLSFGEDADTLLFTTGSPEYGTFETNIRIHRLDLERLGAQPVLTGYDYNRVPVISPDGSRLAFAARTNGGGSLSIYEMDQADGALEQYSLAAFQSIRAMAYRSDGTLVVNGTPGVDPFDTMKIDQANGFQRVFLLGRNGVPDPSPFRALEAGMLGLHGEYNDKLLLTAPYDLSSGVTDTRLALMDADLASHHFVDLPEMKGRAITGATIAGRTGLVAARGVAVGDDGQPELIAVKGVGAALIADLVAGAARSTIVL